MKVLGKVTQNLREHFNDSEEMRKGFAIGFAAGQAEKVYLNVCKAAMFRPSKHEIVWYLPAIEEIAKNYGLFLQLLNVGTGIEETPYEIWIYKDVKSMVWSECEVNSSEWHLGRAIVCGIPMEEIDLGYHLRDGYGEECH